MTLVAQLEELKRLNQKGTQISFPMFTNRILLLITLVLGQCPNPIVRREWRQLSADEKRRFLSAVQALHDRPAGGSDPSTWNYAQFAQVHWDFQQANHDRPPFFPWHRDYIHHYEQALRSIDSAVTLPYWDWTLDSQNPAGSDLLTAQNFGLNGSPGTNCMQTGVAAGWASVAGPSGCLKRCNQFGSLYPPEAVAAIMNRATEFRDFAGAIENGPHGAVHIQLGGQCGDVATMASANDPIFFLHHAMVDKIWWRWQTGCPDFATKYSGSSASSMPPFPETIAQIMSTTGAGGSPLCYSYSQSAGDVPLRLNCPSTQTTTSGSASPSPTVNVDEFWLERLIQSLVPGTDAIRVGNLTHNNAGSSLVRRDYVPVNFASSVPVAQPSPSIGVPEGYPNGNQPAVTTTQALIATTTMDGAYPTPTTINYVWNTSYKIKAPKAQNFSDTVHLRHPTPLKPDFIKMMRMDETKVRNVENFVKMIIDDYNNKDGYISPAALTHYQEYNKLWKPKCSKKK
jgi:tyrosinase